MIAYCIGYGTAEAPKQYFIDAAIKGFWHYIRSTQSLTAEAFNGRRKGAEEYLPYCFAFRLERVS